jgi:hypothetical protein
MCSTFLLNKSLELQRKLPPTGLCRGEGRCGSFHPLAAAFGYGYESLSIRGKVHEVPIKQDIFSLSYCQIIILLTHTGIMLQ